MTGLRVSWVHLILKQNLFKNVYSAGLLFLNDRFKTLSPRAWRFIPLSRGLDQHRPCASRFVRVLRPCRPPYKTRCARLRLLYSADGSVENKNRRPRAGPSVKGVSSPSLSSSHNRGLVKFSCGLQRHISMHHRRSNGVLYGNCARADACCL